jgi:hypothetical protein
MEISIVSMFGRPWCGVGGHVQNLASSEVPLHDRGLPGEGEAILVLRMDVTQGL